MKIMSAIRFTTTLFTLGRWTILRLPEGASEKLPSRGQVMVEGTMNGVHFQAALEPDGKWSHWLKVSGAMSKAIGAGAGDSVTVVIEPTKEWPEPNIPKDVTAALEGAPAAAALWKKITPMARWEWLRWIGATKNPDTRARRIATSLSKLKAGERRPCCFNRAMCTDPYLSKNGVLLEPANAPRADAR
jgi:hypothetical protein